MQSKNAEQIDVKELVKAWQWVDCRCNSSHFKFYKEVL